MADEDHRHGGRKPEFHEHRLESPFSRPDYYGSSRSPKRPRTDHHSPPRSSHFHGGRAAYADHRRREEPFRQDESFSRGRDHHRHDGFVRRRDSLSPPPRRRDFHDGDRSPRMKRHDDRPRDERHRAHDHRFRGDRDEVTLDRQRDSQEDAGSNRFANRERISERGEEELPELYSIHRASVQSVRPFGLFVRLDGFVKQGLVHLSQLSNQEVTKRDDPDELKVEAIAAVAGEGDQVWVKVISVRQEGANVKVGCSLKFVSQSTGEDLDPNNVKLEQQQSRGNREEPKRVTLDAVYNVVCTRCGGHGHLKTECYSIDKKHYELLPDIDDQPIEQPQQPIKDSKSMSEPAVMPGFGRGRAMVLPAWMTHGVGASHLKAPVSNPREKKVSQLPERVTTVEEALAVIEQVKKDKREKRHSKKSRRGKHKKEGEADKASKRRRKHRKERGDKSA